MGNGEEARSWWQTLPGIITSLTAAVTALGGLVVAIKETGVLNPFYSPEPASSCERLSRSSVLPTGAVFRDCKCCPEMVVLPDGSAISKYEVNKEEYATYIRTSKKGDTIADTENRCYVFRTVGDNGRWEGDAATTWEKPGFVQNDDEPVVCVSWNDAKSYANWLSSRSGKHYDLPTKDELTYATRADAKTNVFWNENEVYCQYANINDQQSHSMNAFKWDWARCTDGYPQVVSTGIRQIAGKDALFKPNQFGVFHLIGNVYEWLSTDQGCDIAGQTWIWGGSWTAAPDKALAAPAWCQSREFKAVDIGIRVIRKDH
jgi:formylglycine-generating enzyme required for sulfatase activity